MSNCDKKKNETIISSGNNLIQGNCSIYGNLCVENDLMIKSNVFFSDSIYLNNSLNLQSEIINDNNLINYSNLIISNSFYELLLNNVINSIHNTFNTKLNKNISKYSSIKFYSEKNKFIASSIILINKKFNINKKIILTSGLFYIVFVKKQIIFIKPISETFIITNQKYKLINVIKDDVFVNFPINTSQNSDILVNNILTEYISNDNIDNDLNNLNNELVEYDDIDDFTISDKSNNILPKKKLKLNFKFVKIKKNKKHKNQIKKNNKLTNEESGIDSFLSNLIFKNLDEKIINNIFQDLTNNKK